jgi:hypothetical protein
MESRSISGHIRLQFGALPLLLLPLTCGGCVGVTAATLGTVIGAAGSAVGTGADIYGLGKLKTAQMASLADTVAATQAAARDLHLKLKCERKEKDQTTHLEFCDDKCAKLEVRIEPRTPSLVHIRIDVGLFGSEPTARLFLARLRTHLPHDVSPVPKADES